MVNCGGLGFALKGKSGRYDICGICVKITSRKPEKGKIAPHSQQLFIRISLTYEEMTKLVFRFNLISHLSCKFLF